MFGWRRWRKFSTENVAPPALVFGLAGFVDPVVVELRVIHGKQLIILDRRARLGSHHGLVMVEIQKPDDAGDQQKYDENGELFLLLHAAVRNFRLLESLVLELNSALPGNGAEFRSDGGIA